MKRGEMICRFSKKPIETSLRHVIESVEQVDPLFNGYAKLEEDDA